MGGEGGSLRNIPITSGVGSRVCAVHEERHLRSFGLHVCRELDAIAETHRRDDIAGNDHCSGRTSHARKGFFLTGYEERSFERIGADCINAKPDFLENFWTVLENYYC